jgi:hypothetical protein
VASGLGDVPHGACGFVTAARSLFWRRPPFGGGQRGDGAAVRPGVPHGARAFAEVNAALMDDRGASNLR